MSPSPQLAPPGSSNYNSDTMSVGDGTWDTSRNTFLLPNLVGFNFDTMRYNGKPCARSKTVCKHLTFFRDGQSFSGTAWLLQPDIAAWYFSSDYLSFRCTLCDPHTTILRPKSEMGVKIPYMVTDPYIAVDDSRVRSRMDCRGTTKEVIESAP